MPKKTGLIVFVVILLIGLAISIYFLRFRQDIRQHASETTSTTPQNIAAVVGTQSITKEMVQKAALEQYAEKAITPNVRKVVLDVLIERAILDQEAAKNNISITEEEMSQNSMGGTIGKYEILKQKITSKFTQSVEAYTIGYWVPPKNYNAPLTIEQKTEIAKIRLDGKRALIEAAEGLRTQDALTVAQNLVKKYPSLGKTLGVNGYIMSRTKDTLLMTNPRTYTNDPQTKGQPFFDTLFSMKAGEIKTALNSEDSGGSVIKLTKKTDAKYRTYDEYLKAKKLEMVKINTHAAL